MKDLTVLTLVAVLASLQLPACAVFAETDEVDELRQVVADMDVEMENLEAELEHMKQQFSNLARQVMLQQFNFEHRTRTSGQSGVKTIRGTNLGPRNYQAVSHMHTRFLMIHDHSDYRTTVGMGELNAVINGVEFTTRHNDYMLVMPDDTTDEYEATKEIPWPEVPPSVLALEDVDDQCKEMAEYFRAFRDQDINIRDYRPYFKPVMCYMEGAWTLDDEEVTESFESERHYLAASTWMELQDIIRYNAYTGVKDTDENMAHLPTKIMDFDSTTGDPIYAQWNYRILCYPIEEEVPTNKIVQLTDLKYSYYHKETFKNTRDYRNARFALDDYAGSLDTQRYNILDRIMYTIPGKNNRASNLNLESYDEDLYVPFTDKTVPLDTSLYSRSTDTGSQDAMGGSFLIRGWNEQFMFVAETTQPKVAPIPMDTCNTKTSNDEDTECIKYETRMSWAIPLEIIYTTPLNNWNPLNIPHREHEDEVRYNGRNGKEEEKALDGTWDEAFYRTPAQFYEGPTPWEDGADTAEDTMWVLDNDGNPQLVSPTGSRVSTMLIRDGVGNIRLRFPIAPVHGEGGGDWMEVNALKDWVMEMTLTEMDKNTFIRFNMSTTTRDPPGEHTHTFNVSCYDIKTMLHWPGHLITVTTEESLGHTHTMEIKFNDGEFRYSDCELEDDDLFTCSDGHPQPIYPWPEDVEGRDFFPKIYF